jgi:YggT family protein
VIAAANVVLNVLCFALSVYWYVLLAYVLVSWAFVFGLRRPYSGPGRMLLDALDAVVLPVVRPLGRLVPPIRMGGMGIDLSVILAFVILWVLRVAVCG